jgi:hypothetical protein
MQRFGIRRRRGEDEFVEVGQAQRERCESRVFLCAVELATKRRRQLLR